MKFFKENAASFSGNKNTMSFASFPRRFFALIIDIIAIQTLFMLVSVLLPANNFTLFSNVTLIVFLDLVVSICYYAAFDGSKYQATIGKMFMSIKVVNASGKRISFLSAFIRSVVKNISSGLPFLYLICTFTKKKQTLHDFAGKTFVVNQDSSVSSKSERSLNTAMVVTILLVVLAGILFTLIAVFVYKAGVNFDVIAVE